MFSLGMATPNITALVEGRVAGKIAFDVIERMPKINPDSPDKKIVGHVEGKIELKNVSFYYPSRPDTMVLKDFTATFEKGKTTAIVGASGSGKSTIV